ncbi:hypothetical protein KM1_261690 [Entamoeba histolytica HM-3:IMSS]|nr:hypothetical protein KM1_261690 [Entamoeba histolytica HM-3:IMSS]
MRIVKKKQKSIQKKEEGSTKENTDDIDGVVNKLNNNENEEEGTNLKEQNITGENTEEKKDREVIKEKTPDAVKVEISNEKTANENTNKFKKITSWLRKSVNEHFFLIWYVIMPIIILIIVVFVALIIAIPDIKTSKEKYFYSFIGLLGLSYLVIGSLVLFVLLFFKIMYDLITQIIKIRNEQINTKSQWMLLFELVSPCLSKLVKKFWLWCKPYEKDHKWISWGLRIIHWVTIALSFVVLILFIVSLGFMTKDAKNMIGYWILFVVSSVFIGLIYVIKELRECIENAEKKHTSNNTSVNDTNTPTNKRTDNDTSSKTKQKKSKKK